MSTQCPPRIDFHRHVLRDVESASRKEWLLTNGIGGFACGTVAGVRTRRYHGLLTAATQPPTGRLLILGEVEAWVKARNTEYPLSTHIYRDTLYPAGMQHLHRFQLHPHPTHIWATPNARVQREVWLIPGKNTVAIRYTLLNGAQQTQLRLIPLFACRDYHALTRANPVLDATPQEIEKNTYRLTPYPGFPAVYLFTGGARLVGQPDWYYSFHYPVERGRGLDDIEDLWTPGILLVELQREQSVTIVISLEPTEQLDWQAPPPTEVPPPFNEHPLAAALWCAADQFVIERPQGKSVIAGYPWFTDWGRDTMIALRGIFLVRRQFQEAREVLQAFAKHMRDGLIPNRFPDYGEEPEYNTADATLWFAWMADCYRLEADDEEFFQEVIYPRLKECLEAYLQGTRFGIRVDTRDGLLRAGEPGWQLTWMDAKVGDHVITPREGKPVEIVAMWLEFLRVLHEAAHRYDDLSVTHTTGELLHQARQSFMPTFWIDDLDHLADAVDDAGRQDPRLRPNQLIALAIPDPPLPCVLAQRILRKVDRHLLTPYGLRTLAPFDPDYRARYEGDVYTRDSAYHQGTVWTWLLGPYADAMGYAFGDTPATRSRLRSLLKPFEKHLYEAGLGTVSEIFDGNPPHHPRGCFAQAWSVAELLRIWWLSRR